MSIPRIHNQEQTIMGHLSAYHSVGSSPKDPVAIAAAKEFGNPVPAIIQPAGMTIEQLKVEGRAALRDHESGCSRFVAAVSLFETRWRELGPTRDLACNEMFGCGLNALHKRLSYRKSQMEKAGDSTCLSPEEDKKNTLTHIADLPDPTLPTSEELLGTPAPSEPTPEAAKPAPAPKPAPVQAEHQPRERNDSGKPVYALAVWKDLYNDYGHALNKIHDAHRALPNLKRRERMVKATKDLMDEAESWKNEAKSL